jgi:O-antigen/teichoic acid export membrane protein
MRLFQKVYIAVGGIILALGVVLFPFLDNFIKNGQSVPQGHYFYLVFLLNTVVSYLWTYKRSLLIADQKQYVVNIYQAVVQVLVAVLQMIFLLIFTDYWCFIILMLMGTVLENFSIAHKADKEYPYLNEEAEVLGVDIKQQIVKNTKAMICHKIGGMVVFSSSNLVLSKFAGLAAVGLYSNYYMVIATLNAFAAKFFESITASIGNLMVLEKSSKKIKAFKVTEFITALQAAICFCGLYVLFNPFVELWVGKAYLFSEAVVAAMAFSFYLTYMRKSVLMFRDACWLYWNDRYKPLAESVINLVALIYLTIHYGVVGVVVGVIISTLLTCFWVEPYVLFNNGIDIKLKDYFADYLKFNVVALLSALASKFIYSSLFANVTLVNFMAGILICISVTFVLWYVIFINREEMRYLVQLAKSKFVK